ncbi:type IV pilus modification protein PilV [Rheinheimera maricola]|uniref:Type IV pilus modification protein PilV n=1 Tax=Rheinheimera maricola TaxID=2793282 RepID=A0ABS7XAH5_9GAMM|nr:type IV pilus modification protein PilV [Rheinheimera maricola]MBZ9612532.1 type IV pilus modification protein PilV [Rheinheimera maricola]
MKPISSFKQQRGVSLMEVLISVLVLSIGLLGVAALQTSSMRHTNSSLERTMAVILTDTLSELLRANPIAARQGDYAFSDCAGNTALGTAAWVQDVKQATRDDACPVVSWDDERYTVTIVWGDERINADSKIVTQVMP